MKNKRIKVLYIIFFIAAIFFAAFVLAEFRRDYLAVGLAAVVMLIAAYFLVDKVERDIYDRYNLDKKEMDEKLGETTGEIRRGFDKIDKLSEAILEASLQGLTDPKEKLSELVDDLTQAEQSIQSQQETIQQKKDKQLETNEIELILKTQRETMDLIKAGFKTLIQYSKENARQVALNTNQNTEQLLKELTLTMQQLTDQLPNIVQDHLQDVESKYESISEAYLENISLVSQKLDKIKELSNQISDKLQL